MIGISQLVNEVDKSDFTLYTEWQDECFKVILLRSSMIPLSGMMNTANADYFLHHLDESLDTYFKKTKCAFSGKNEDIRFYLENDEHSDGKYTFTWKEGFLLTRGKITVYPLSDILMISGTLKYMLEHYQKCQEQILALEEENERLEKTNEKLVMDIEAMINTKNTMEKDIYNRFILLLNSKKMKIRELQEVLDSRQQEIDKKQTTKSVYDETTDDEMTEDEEFDEESKEERETAVESIKKERKRKIDCRNKQKVTPKISKNFERCTNFSSSESPSPEPSTSKGKLLLQDTDTWHTTKSKLIISEEESEEDLFSQ